MAGPHHADEKIDHAVKDCLAQAATAERPFQSAAEFFATLKNNSNWTDTETIEVQTSVIDELIVRADDEKEHGQQNVASG